MEFRRCLRDKITHLIIDLQLILTIFLFISLLTDQHLIDFFIINSIFWFLIFEDSKKELIPLNFLQRLPHFIRILLHRKCFLKHFNERRISRSRRRRSSNIRNQRRLLLIRFLQFIVFGIQHVNLLHYFRCLFLKLRLDLFEFPIQCLPRSFICDCRAIEVLHLIEFSFFSALLSEYHFFHVLDIFHISTCQLLDRFISSL